MSEPKAGTHGFDGECIPGKAHAYGVNHKTFSVGVFEWLPKYRKGLKAGKVKVRVRGLTADPDPCLKRAAEIAAQLDAGTYDGPKVVEAWK